jgi:arsenate reductase (thioredoxin)
VTVHWGIPDPAEVSGTEEEKRAAFAAAFATLSRRLSRLAALPVSRLRREALAKQLAEIGRIS